MPSTVVQAGQSLASIAKRKGINLLDLIRANPQLSDPNLIRPGQQIRIPSGTYSASERSKAAVRAGMSATGRPEDVGRYAVNEQGQLVQSNFAPAIAEAAQAPDVLNIPGPLSRPTRGGVRPTPNYLKYLDEQARAGLVAPNIQPFRDIPGPTDRPTRGALFPRQVTQAETKASLSRMAGQGVTPFTRGGASVLSAAAIQTIQSRVGAGLPQPDEGIARGAVGQNVLRPTWGQDQIPFDAASPEQIAAMQQVLGQTGRQEPTRRAVGTGRTVAGTTPAYQSPDVRQLQEQKWDQHIGIVALQILNGRGFPTYTLSGIINDPRLRNVLNAYFANAGVDISGLTTPELLEIMGYTRVGDSGEVYYRSDSGAATGGVGTFGGTVYSGGYSGGGYYGGGGRRGGRGGGLGSRGGGFGGGSILIDWRINA